MSVDGSIDYSNYTLDELLQARGSVNRYLYPRNAQMIDHWVNVREGKIPADTPPPAPQQQPSHKEIVDENLISERRAKISVEPLPPPKELSFSKVISDTVTFVWNRKLDLIRSLAPIYIIIILFEILQMFVAKAFGSAGAVATSVISTIVYAMFAVTCHRMVLLGNDSIPKFGTLIPNKRVMTFWGMTILLSLGAGIFIVAISTLLSFFLVGLSIHLPVWLYLLAGLPILYFMSRMSLAFPAIALDEFQSLGWCWAVTRGNGISLVALVLVPVIPIYLIEYFSQGNESLSLSITTTFIGFAFAVMGIIFISLSYKELSVKVDEGSV